MGAYVVRTSSLNSKHSCQHFSMGLRDITTPTRPTPLVRTTMSCAVATIFSSLAFLSSSVSMANLSHLVVASFSSLALLSYSVSMANLSCLLVTPSPVLSFSPTHCHTLLQSFESCQMQFLVVFLFSYFHVLSSVSKALFALSFPLLIERFLFIQVRADLVYSQNE